MENLTNKKTEDLKKLLAEKRAALRRFYFGASGSRSRNVKEGKMLRKDIARILTEFNERRRS